MAKILICDDDIISSSLLREILKKYHPEYQLVFVTDGAQAMEKLSGEPFDMLLLDVVMPGMSGFEVLEKIKENKNLSELPVLLITVMSETEQKISGFKLGARDYIVKPINAEEVIARVEAHLKIKEDTDNLRRLNEEILRTQAALVESSKMAAVGNLATGIAHEFNNILFMMHGTLQVHKGSGKKGNVETVFSVMNELVKRGSGVVRGLLDFASGDGSRIEAGVDEILLKDLKLLDSQLIQNNIEVNKQFGAVPRIKCSPGKLSQVFVNLILNAIEAMTGIREKKLEIKTQMCKGDCKVCRVDSSRDCQSGKGCVVVSFSDTGKGVPADIKQKMFNPFLTTKGILGGGDESAPGKGLGLYISYGIISGHGGFLSYSAAENGGACFSVVLPV